MMDEIIRGIISLKEALYLLWQYSPPVCPYCGAESGLFNLYSTGEQTSDDYILIVSDAVPVWNCDNPTCPMPAEHQGFFALDDIEEVKNASNVL